MAYRTLFPAPARSARPEGPPALGQGRAHLGFDRYKFPNFSCELWSRAANQARGRPRAERAGAPPSAARHPRIFCPPPPSDAAHLPHRLRVSRAPAWAVPRRPPVARSAREWLAPPGRGGRRGAAPRATSQARRECEPLGGLNAAPGTPAALCGRPNAGRRLA